MPLSHFIKAAAESPLSFDEVRAFCRSKDLTLHKFSDTFALEVATSYLAGEIDFGHGGAALNSLFGFMVSDLFFAETDRTIPDLAFAIYKAFDEGEYVHPADRPGDVQEEKYTRPQLRAIVAAANAP